MVKTTVYLDETTVLKVRQIARTAGRSQADVIREAIRAYTRKAERPRPEGIGRYRSGRSNVAQRSEEILRRAARERR